ncbi:MAG: type II toxin-antitoxin system HigB family toxin [Candidatus Symbiothrix sp.]|jgi:mRNA interferase HigB|nr:type II toxin-antitoxin system HigB family toxin [Candidatus Symbiothrix sp.]
MRVIAHSTIVDFYTNYADSKQPLEEWYAKTRKADWNCFADIKKTFNSVDTISNQRFVFNIKGNSYRLITIVLFIPKMVYIRFIGTHAEYDKINDCSKI